MKNEKNEKYSSEVTEEAPSETVFYKGKRN